MELDGYAAGLARGERLDRARGVIGKSATEINHALGGIIDLTGDLTDADKPLGPRVQAFARADLDGILARDAQADISDRIHPLIPYRNRLEHDQWTTLRPRMIHPTQSQFAVSARSATYTRHCQRSNCWQRYSRRWLMRLSRCTQHWCCSTYSIGPTTKLAGRPHATSAGRCHPSRLAPIRAGAGTIADGHRRAAVRSSARSSRAR